MGTRTCFISAISVLFTPLSLLCSGCHSIPDSTSVNYNNSAICTQINQSLSAGPAQNATFLNQPITSADRADLLKKYNEYGCDANSNKPYAYPGL